MVTAEVPFYLTFTNPDMSRYGEFCGRLRESFGEGILADSFIIPLIEYRAVPFVDLVP
jgi:hypothetical protein